MVDTLSPEAQLVPTVGDDNLVSVEDDIGPGETASMDTVEHPPSFIHIFIFIIIIINL